MCAYVKESPEKDSHETYADDFIPRDILFKWLHLALSNDMKLPEYAGANGVSRVRSFIIE